MAKALFVKSLSSLHPADDEARALLRNIGQGEVIYADISRPRNIIFHRRFFAMLKIVLDNQDFYKGMDDILDVCKLAIGHYRTVETKAGPVKIPSSISFAAMDDAAFSDFYDRAVAWVCSDVIEWMRRKDLDEEVETSLLSFGESP